ncbi:MAG: GFA family protein [Betaproteobacteria bacterium]|nr:MAG: GFA family protein [Betaproteobacteria bacterium]
MPTPRTGGCLCGAIRYAISAPITELRACHCIDCQRASGSHGTVAAFIPRDGFKLTQGAPKHYAKKADSGRTLIRYFCGDCGSQLYSHRETTPELLGVRAGTLDDSADLKISTHIWTKSARPWSHLDPAAKQVEGQPS